MHGFQYFIMFSVLGAQMKVQAVAISSTAVEVRWSKLEQMVIGYSVHYREVESSGTTLKHNLKAVMNNSACRNGC